MAGENRTGQLIAARRKNMGLTQKELARRLGVTDKAVSKWERGIGMPDVSLLQPISEALGVSVTELLGGEAPSPKTKASPQEQARRMEEQKRWKLAYAACAAGALMETGLLLSLGFSAAELADSVFLLVGLCLLFGAWLCFLASETLPGYYDQNRISFYSDGVFRINLPGVRFNNRNWPHVLNAMRVWLLGAEVLYPLLWLAGAELLPGTVWEVVRLPLTLCACLGFLVAAYTAGKKYE